MTREFTSQPTTGLRRRRAPEPLPELSVDAKAGKENLTSSSKLVTPAALSPTAGFLVLILALAISVASMMLVHEIPQRKLRTLSRTPPTSAAPFELSRAMDHIRTIAARPRWVGTTALHESLAYIHSEIAALQPMAERHKLVLEVETTVSGAGSYIVSIVNIDLILSYNNITNVVARLRPAHLTHDTEASSLLVNAHVDSAVGSPGASDNVAGVGVVMELLRCIASSDVHTLSRPVVFLFNAAEEPVLVGAHAFIKFHRWANRIAAHINLESLGSGDTYHLFRLGPHSTWLGEAYANAVSMPSTSVTASDLFESKIIPGETDFRIFSEFANIPGYDFVLLDNGFVYHSIYDSVEKVDPVGVSHGGLIILELIMELAGTRDAIGKHEAPAVFRSTSNRLYDAVAKMADSLHLVRKPGRPRTVFFDILRRTTVVYGEGVAAILHMGVLFITTLIWAAKLADMGIGETKACLRMSLVLVSCVFAAFASATFASLVYAEVHGSKLRWYGDWRTCAIMFAPPTVFGTVSALLLFLPRRLYVRRFDHMLFAVTGAHVLTTVGFMSVGFMSSFVPILFLTVANICALQGEKVHPFIRHLEMCIPYAIIGAKMITTALFSILPLLGRSKSESVPHDTIAALLIAFFTFFYLLLPSLPILCYFARSLRRIQMSSFIASVAIGVWLVMFVPAMEGTGARNAVYSTDAPKRIVAFHFFSPQQEPNSIFGLASQDPISMEVDRLVSGLSPNDKSSDRATKFPLWGDLQSTCIETFRPFQIFVQDVVVFAAEDPPELAVPTVEVFSAEDTDAGWNVTYIAKAVDSHQLTVRFPIGKNFSVVGWSLDVPIKDSPDGAWIRHIGSSNFRFWVMLRKGEEPAPRPKLRMAVTSGRLGVSRSPRYLRKLIFKEWEAPMYFVSTGIEMVV